VEFVSHLKNGVRVSLFNYPAVDQDDEASGLECFFGKLGDVNDSHTGFGVDPMEQRGEFPSAAGIKKGCRFIQIFLDLFMKSRYYMKPIEYIKSLKLYEKETVWISW